MSVARRKIRCWPASNLTVFAIRHSISVLGQKHGGAIAGRAGKAFRHWTLGTAPSFRGSHSQDVRLIYRATFREAQCAWIGRVEMRPVMRTALQQRLLQPRAPSLAADLAEFGRMLRISVDPYRPESHTTCGPGPKLTPARPGADQRGCLRGSRAVPVSGSARHFREKRNPVFRQKMQQCKIADAVSVSGSVPIACRRRTKCHAVRDR